MGPTGKLLVSVLILAVLVFQWSWDLPPDSIFARAIAPFRRPLGRIGLGHTWRLFAPRPVGGDRHVRFEVQGRDGDDYVVPLPPDDLDRRWGRPRTRYGKVRQALLNDGHPRFRRSFARWVVDGYLPQGGPATGRPWDGPARVRCLVVQTSPPPLSRLGEPPPPPVERQVFVEDLPAPEVGEPG